MRLIHTSTLQLHEFVDETAVEYAILSHRWQDEELSFQIFQDLDLASKKAGFDKVRRVCEQALRDGHEYVWCDTCCIDKTSSSELSEAINSMFRYYASARVCYVHLVDVNLASKEKTEVFAHSSWFTRGWTLQELIAPRDMVFCDQDWRVIGTKRSLATMISERTGIEEDILTRVRSHLDSSVAQRMSWAADRTTSRKEDVAYCLLGIFDVNMPLLYGEGEKAFLRLQHAIVAQTHDHSIFAWPMHEDGPTGLLAKHPKAFRQRQAVRSIDRRVVRSPHGMTNRGLSITLAAVPYAVDTYLVRLDCDEGVGSEFRNTYAEDPGPAMLVQPRLAILVRRLDSDDQYARVDDDGRSLFRSSLNLWDTESLSMHRPARLLTINVPERVQRTTLACMPRVNGFRLSDELLGLSGGSDGRFIAMPNDNVDLQTGLMHMPPNTYGTVGTLDIEDRDRKLVKRLKLGFDFDFNPVCFIATGNGLRHLSFDSFAQGLDTPGRNLGKFPPSNDEYKQLRSLDERSPYDELAWSIVNRGVARSLKWHSGLWAIKGDRIDGIDVDFGTTGVLRITRGVMDKALVWDVFLEDSGVEHTGAVSKLRKRLGYA